MEAIFAKIICQKKDSRDRYLDQKATGFNELLLPLGSKEGEIIDELKLIEDEIIVMKTTNSALTGTNLHNIGIDTIIVIGVFTDQCVFCIVRSLANESFKVYLIEDGCMAATEEI